MPDKPRVTLVHERFTEVAGSEKVVAELAAAYRDAPVLAPAASAQVLADPAMQLTGRVSGDVLTPLLRGTGYAHLLPLLPWTMRHLPVDSAPSGRPDVVVVSHHAFAAQCVYATAAPVLAYVHSPARWVYDPRTRRGETGGPVGQALLAAFAAVYRGADRAAAARLTRVVANSTAVADRVRRWWGRDAEVIHPPVDIEYYCPDPAVGRERFALLAGRLVPYKRPELAVRAAAAAGIPLVVAGTGRSEAQCRAVAGPDTTFLGHVDDATLRALFRRCRLLLMPGVEDFGIVPVEAQACGAPVLAAAAGGSLDIVRPEETGRLIETPDDDDQAVDVWADQLVSGWISAVDPRVARKHAEGFGQTVFRERMGAAVTAVAAGGTAGV